MGEPLSKTELNCLIEQQMYSYHSMLSTMANVECEAKTKRMKKGCFDFIAHAIPPVANCITLAKAYMTEEQGIRFPKFLDCGCGYGNIMILAYHLNCSAYGIELNERALKLARLNNGKNDLMSGGKHWAVYRRDILTYKDYDKYDIVYYYCPMRHGKLEVEFEKKLADDMRVGAIVLPFYSISTFVKDKRFEYLGDHTNIDKYRHGHIMRKIKE